MASIKKRVTPAGRVVYDVMWRERVGGGWRQRREAQADWNAARSRKAQIEHDQLNNRRRVVKGRRSKVTVAEAVLRWSEVRDQRESTRANVRSFVKVHLEPTELGRMRLADVTHDDVQAWATDRARVLSASTLRQRLKLLRGTINRAVRFDELDRSPILRDDLHVPEPPGDEAMPLERDEVARLAEAMPPLLRNAVVVQVGLGLRIGELLGMRAGEVVVTVSDGPVGPS